ncbi:putative ATPase/DNA-binding CsgD family transcriptional regulator [Paenibacillus endophyticus]|uniref:Putative ATPase/DNA-binding CsgD family transcriptional regulator n=1 Tax=Paenibacillus endophyticus TaxID=1294268 RepID=A0A7W5CDI1_9BACL|nr:AAA family ATPase [Paenibacillus endophyticus]MBB3155721.1 putative ATPase/DNA-binding CsgD family transcriptional regulator [Paenibacillus endophyticus]
MPHTERIKLKEWLKGTPLEILTFLHIAISITEQAHSAHKRGTVLGNLNPAHIVLDSETYLAVIEEKRETDYIYISPEQTGRLNRSPDERSDLYVLGMIYYELLAGRGPFQAEGAEEWIHAHLAIVPPPLKELRPELPESLGAIIMKLLSKSPEERYQSAYGLLMDLKRCISSLINEGCIVSFGIAQADEASRFLLPRTLFGREEEEEQLRKAYEKVRSGESAFVIVSGHAGSGKTALIRQFQVPVTSEGGQFVAGKCELMNRDIPFSPILQALRRLIKQTLGESPKRLGMVKTRLSKELGQGAGVIAAFLPEAKALFGEIPSVEVLPPAEASIRLRRLLPIFIKAFVDKSHPLVLFLDDLQWADSATLEVLRTVVQDKLLHGLYLIGSFREETVAEEIGSGELHHDAEVWLEHSLFLKANETPMLFQHIALSPLSYIDVRLFVTQILNENTSRVRLLAESLYHQTGGNPMYLHHLLDSHYREREIYFDEEASMWAWEAAIVTQMPEDTGILHLIDDRIRKLSAETTELLAVAAAIGHRFLPTMIALVSGLDVFHTRMLLQSVEAEGLLYQEYDANGTDNGYYTFLHDRVQQSAYQLIPVSAKAGLHLKIGRVLRTISPSEKDEMIFDMVYHLNLGIDEMTDEAERNELAEYNLQAGLKSKAATAFTAALHYLNSGMRLVQDDSKGTQSIAYRLMLEMPECEYMCGRTDAAEALLNLLMLRTTDVIERSRIHMIRIGMNSYLKRDDIAVNIGRQALEEFGWRLPLKPSKAEIAKEVMLAQVALHSKRKELAHLPINRDPHYKALSDLVMAISTSVFTLSLELAAVLFSKFIRFGLKHGNNEAFAYLLAGHGLVILRNKISLFRTGLYYIDTAILLSASFESNDLQCRLNYIRGLARLQQNPEEGVRHFEKAIRYGMESANLTYVSIAMLTSTTTHTGDLHALSVRISDFERISQMLVDEVTHNIFRIARWYVARLQDESEEIAEIVLPLQKMNSEETLNHEVYYMCTCQIEIAYLESRYRDALDWVEKGRFNTFRQTRMQVRKQHIYHALTLAAMFGDSLQEEREDIRRALSKQLDEMKKWTGYFGQRSSAYLLIRAEFMRIDGNLAAATKGYEAAIRTARLENHSLMEAVALESASICYRETGSTIGADTLMADACAAFLKWGAVAKVRKLRETYPELRSTSIVSQEAYRTIVEELESMETKRELMPVIADERTLLQQVSGWSSKDVSQMLLNRFLETVLRYSGAEKGYVLNSDEENFSITDQLGEGGASVDTMVYAETIVRYVIKTGESVVLADASLSSFAADPYIRRFEPISVLCMPILVPGKPLQSLLYLENNLIAGVFTKDVRDMLDLMITRMLYLKSLEESKVQVSAASDVELHLAVIPTEDQLQLPEHLTKRETEILYALIDGLSNKEIAHRFGLTEGTVKSYFFRLYGKLGVKRRAQAIARARELLLVD